jgi:toxin CcdB
VIPEQFAVHRNPGRNQRVIPFVVVVQSNRFRDSGRQVVVPLLAAEQFGVPDSDVGPRFMVEGRPVVFDPLQITNVPRQALGRAIASLASEDARIINAMDAFEPGLAIKPRVPGKAAGRPVRR